MFNNLLTTRWCTILTGTLIATAPLIGLALFVYISVSHELEILSGAQRQAVAYTVSHILEEKIQGLIAYENIFITRTPLITAIIKDNVKEMRQNLQSLVENSSKIDRVFITSPTGTLIADYPTAPGSIGKDFSQRDWYRGVSRSWKPYISEFYQSTESQHNVFAIAVPIKSTDGTVVGILVMQPTGDFVKKSLDSISQNRGNTYLVDKNGTIIYHPELTQDKTVTISGNSIIKKVMMGLEGSENGVDPLTGTKVISAYHPVNIGGWGVITESPLEEALGPVKTVSRGIYLFTAIMLLVSAWLAYLRSELIISRKRASDDLQQEDTINKAYGDVLTLINQDWFSVEDLTQAALLQLNSHVSLLAGVSYLVQESGLVAISSMGTPLPSTTAGGIVQQAFQRNEIVTLLDISIDSVLSISTVAGIVVPREIIAIPVTVKNETVAVLELASLHGFGETDLRIINRVIPQLGIGINTIKSGQVQKMLLVERNRIFNLSLDMICISGFDGYFKQLNPAWEKTLGWNNKELMEKPFLLLVHPEDRESTFKAAKGLTEGRILTNFENRYACADGSYKWISLNSYPLVEEGLIFSMARDVTAQKVLEQEINDRSCQLETANYELQTINEESQKLNGSLQNLNDELQAQQEELAVSNRRLEEVSRAKSDFLANMSHELRTPLNSVIGFSEVLQDQMFGPINDKQKEYVKNILISGKHLLSLINDILDLAKVESGKMELDLGKFSLRELLNNSMMMLREKALKGEIGLSITLTPEADVLVTADQRKIKQILFNLLSNAVKFTPAGGTVDVSAIRVGAFIEISVVDTGIGIKPEDIPKLFQAFTQLESVYTKGFEGTGLGLALTRQLVELHGGNIRVKSEFGIGSEFCFTIPLTALPDVKSAVIRQL